MPNELAKAAYAHEFIQRLPEGYETRVGERQRITSRAADALRQPEIWNLTGAVGVERGYSLIF